MNIIAGFACAIGIDIGYNRGHHVRKHTAGHVKKGCQHENKKGHNQHSAGNKSQKDQTKNDCCKNGVTAFSLLDKSVEKASSLNVPVFYVAQLPEPYPGIFPGYSSIQIDKKSLVRGHHPPIRDIRIAIQSFQV